MNILKRMQFADQIGLAGLYGQKVSEAVIRRAVCLNLIEARRYRLMLAKIRSGAPK